jgi:hypothetical protein
MILSAKKVFDINIYKVNIFVNNFYNKIFVENKNYSLYERVIFLIYGRNKKGAPI